MFGKKGQKTLFNYITSHDPYNDIDDLYKPVYLEGTVSVEHKELETAQERVDELESTLDDTNNALDNITRTLNRM